MPSSKSAQTTLSLASPAASAYRRPRRSSLAGGGVPVGTRT